MILFQDGPLIWEDLFIGIKAAVYIDPRVLAVNRSCSPGTGSWWGGVMRGLLLWWDSDGGGGGGEVLTEQARAPRQSKHLTP